MVNKLQTISNDKIGRHTEIARSGTKMTETRSDAYGYNDRSELTNAVKNATLNEYIYQYDDIGNRETAFERGTKDIFDMYYLREKVDVETFRKYVEILIYKNKKCKVTGKDEVLASLRTTFASRQYLKRLSGANVNWLQLDPQAATFAILVFLEETL